jgi:peptidyl-prolyl cis-trans isomerase A (cyclophilin A)
VQGFDAAIGPHTQFLVGASIKGVVASKLWKRYRGDLLGKATMAFVAIKGACGVDVEKDTDAAMVGGPFEERELVFAVRGAWDATKMEKCFVDIDQSVKVAVRREGRLSVFESERDGIKSRLNIAWLAPDTFALQPGGGADDAQRLLAATSGGAPSKELAELLGKVDRKATLWAVSLIPAPYAARTFEETAETDRPDGVWAQIDHADALKLVVGLRFKDDAAAGRQRAEYAKIVIDELVKGDDAPALAKKLVVGGEGRFLTFTLDASAKDVDQLIAWLDVEENRKNTLMIVSLLMMALTEGGEAKTAPPPELPPEAPGDPEAGDFTLEEATAGLAGAGKTLVAKITTPKGTITCELLPEVAPRTVANFVGLARGVRPWHDPRAGKWVKRPMYDGTNFFRVIPGFMIQGGDPVAHFLPYDESAPLGGGGPGYNLRAELSQTLKFDRPGRLAMARSDHPDSAGSQFFIMDGTKKELDGLYTIFGQCGNADVVSALAGVKTGPPPPENARPLEELKMKVEISRR